MIDERAGVEREGNDVGVGAGSEHNHDVLGCPFGLYGSSRNARHDVENIGARNGRVTFDQFRGSDETRILYRETTQQSFGGDAVERMSKHTGPAVLLHVGDDIRQGLDGWLVAVQQGESLAVVRTHSDFQTCRTGDGIGDRTTHFQTENLARHDSVFDQRVCTTREDERNEGLVLGFGVPRLGERLGNCRNERSLVDVPDGDRKVEKIGLTGQDSRCRLCENVKRTVSLFQRPQQCRAKTACRLFLDEQPRAIAVNDRGAAGKHGGTQRVVSNDT